MPSETGFRIFGDVLDSQKSYIDVEVDGVDSDGNVYLAEGGSGGETWSLSSDRLSELCEDQLVVGQSEIPFPDHQMWNVLEDIGSTRASVDINNFVDERLSQAQKNVFKAILEAGR